MMNPSPTKTVEHFAFVEVTLVQYATVAGHLPGVTGSCGCAAPAACASEGAAEYYRPQPYPRQVRAQTRVRPFLTILSSDMQAPSREADANVRKKDSSAKCEEEESTTSVPKMVPVNISCQRGAGVRISRLGRWDASSRKPAICVGK